MIPTIPVKDIYTHACYHTRPYVYLRALRIYSKNQQLKANSLFVESNTKISNLCNHCNSAIDKDDFIYYAGYWTPHLWKPVHKHCFKEAKELETIACQEIDADCNDCKYFQREKEISKGISIGVCSKFNNKQKSHVNTFTGKKCFEHRKK
jgi:hypothetical protein